jgi:hypothetical protein
MVEYQGCVFSFCADDIDTSAFALRFLSTCSGSKNPFTFKDRRFLADLARNVDALSKRRQPIPHLRRQEESHPLRSWRILSPFNQQPGWHAEGSAGQDAFRRAAIWWRPPQPCGFADTSQLAELS